MMRYVRDLRLIPIALIGSACLLVLTLADIALDGGRWLAARNAPPDEASGVIRTSPDAAQPPGGHLSWAQQMFNFPAGPGVAPSADIAPPPVDKTHLVVIRPDPNSDITGSIAAVPGAPAVAAPAEPGVKVVHPPGENIIPTKGAVLPTGAERAILERLQQRREELDTRSRELDIRESLVKAAEQRITAQLTELKEVEGRIKTETEQKKNVEAARFKSLVTMYENMKARDAAKIFNGLDMEVLLEVATQINPRAMADIMAQMSPDMAERLTVAMASRAQNPGKDSPGALPKIEGKPISP